MDMAETDDDIETRVIFPTKNKTVNAVVTTVVAVLYLGNILILVLMCIGLVMFLMHPNV